MGLLLNLTLGMALAGAGIFTVYSSMTPKDEPNIPSQEPAMEITAIANVDNTGCDISRATKVMKQCKVCHSSDAGKAHKTGPNLFGIYGRQAGAVEKFKFSPAFKKTDFIWNDTTLDGFLANPQKYIKRSRMAYGGVRNVKDRMAIICLLKTLK